MIRNFWVGKITLWKSYWIVGELLNALVIVLIYNFEIRFFKNNLLFTNFPTISFNNLNPISKILIFVWTVYITVGIWRSAENYKGNITWIILTLIILSYRVFTLNKIIL